MIKKILVANRGEIAIRVMRTCREMGIISVAVFSEADRNSMHVRFADEAYFIGPAPSNESYLVIDNIIEVAKKCKADAIHPGYGFLSENALFADRCEKEGIIFIGPSSSAIDTMGDKITARQNMMAADVPVVPGTAEPIKDIKEAVKAIKEIGLPVMVKASAGGGGKGMRLIHDEKDIVSGVGAAKSEAKAAFGNDAVYVEKYISSPHHIEFQILADKHGDCIHLFERECSVQRRHQKVVEETPSPIMTDEVRAEMGKHAVAAAKAVNYASAGTVEFIVDDDLNYYFLEMNTRLQVEHPITERVVGVDLVKEQINIANGLPLTYKQEDLRQSGHAIEVRIYAEDPDNNFMPSPGVVKHITEPLGLGVRHDGYIYEGYEIPMHYDPLISKLIVWAPTRDEAIERMKRALFAYKITGVKTTIPFLSRIMNAGPFKEGRYNTHFIQDNQDLLEPSKDASRKIKDVVSIAAFVDYLSSIESKKPAAGNGTSQVSNWKMFGRRKAMNRF
jgi:acetyl-CoA carboxylase biotin carboxylase subunit